MALLGADEPGPVDVWQADGTSPFLLVCDHAGRRTPTRLGRLGLPEHEFERHIAWDVGAAGVSRLLSAALDATLIEQAYSRLVIDCNRPVRVAGSVPAVSELTEIPGNLGLSPEERDGRIAEIFRPYHDAIGAEIDWRERAKRPTVLVAMHSFTPVYKGEARPWHVGTLYGRDARLARPLREALARDGRLTVGDNQPYAVSDETDWTLPTHGEKRGLLHVGIEIRQDLIGTAAGQRRWAEALAQALPAALAKVGP